MKGQNHNAVKVSAVVAAMLVNVACGGITVKVEKKQKDVNLAQAKSAQELNLANSEDFLKQLDGLKTVAADMLVKELAKKDYRSEVRESIRKYRSLLISKATGPVKIDDSFYSSADQCRSTGLSFNMQEANGLLGIILKTAVLAKLTEMKAPKINPGLSKQIEAITQVILLELGVKVEGDVDIETVGDTTKTIGNVAISLLPISGEAIDDAMKAKDAAEVIEMKFTRSLEKNFIGTFEAMIDVTHLKADASKEILEAKLAIDRHLVAEQMVHTALFNVGVKDQVAVYSRKMMFEQDQAKRHVIKITDTLNPGLTNEVAFISTVDVKAGTQCKGAGSYAGVGDEGNFVPTPSYEGDKKDEPKGEEPKTEAPKPTTPPSTTTGGEVKTTTTTTTTTNTNTNTNTTPGTNTSTTGTTTQPPKGGDDDSDVKTTTDTSKTPGQTPNQSPTQTPVQK